MYIFLFKFSISFKLQITNILIYLFNIINILYALIESLEFFSFQCCLFISIKYLLSTFCVTTFKFGVRQMKWIPPKSCLLSSTEHSFSLLCSQNTSSYDITVSEFSASSFLVLFSLLCLIFLFWPPNNGPCRA